MSLRFEKVRDAFGQADPDLKSYLIQESDKRVAAQVELLKSGDARANGLLATSATLASAGIAVAASKLGAPGDAPLFWAAVGFTVTAVLASGLSVWALWPRVVQPQGWDPDTFLKEAVAEKKLSTFEHSVVALLQRRLDKNGLSLLVLGTRAQLAMVSLASAPVSAAGAGLWAAGHADPGFLLLWSEFLVFLWVALRRSAKVRAKRVELELED